MKKIAIIGAGISGLSVGQLLNENFHITLFEKESNPGGLIRCQWINNSLFHLCGGHVFNSKHQHVLDWFWSIFNKEEEFAKTNRNSVIFMENGQSIPYPIENHVYLLDKDIQFSFIQDLLSLKSNFKQSDNFEDFLRNQFGETLYRLYFKPYNEKIWRRNLKDVPLTWLEGKLPMPSIEDMIYNNFNHIKEKEFVHSQFYYENKNGSQYIADKLSQNLRIRYNTNIESINKRHDGLFEINNEIFDIVIFCGNIKQLPSLLYGIDFSQYQYFIENLSYHGTTTVFCEIAHNPYSWIYLPSTKYESHRIICTGNFNKANNANGITTGTIEFTDYMNIDDIKKNLQKMPLSPQYITHCYNQYTYPIQNNQTQSIIKEIKSRLETHNFYMTGRFTDWEYYNMDAAIDAAMKTCKLVRKAHL